MSAFFFFLLIEYERREDIKKEEKVSSDEILRIRPRIYDSLGWQGSCAIQPCVKHSLGNKKHRNFVFMQLQWIITIIFNRIRHICISTYSKKIRQITVSFYYYNQLKLEYTWITCHCRWPNRRLRIPPFFIWIRTRFYWDGQ